MNSLVTQIQEKSSTLGLPDNVAKSLLEVFMPIVKNLDQEDALFTEIVALPLNKESAKAARDHRIKIKKLRTRTETVRKKQKEFYLLSGKAIDGLSNIIKLSLSGKEDKLLEIENYEAITKAENTRVLGEARLTKIAAIRATHFATLDRVGAETFEDTPLSPERLAEMSATEYECFFEGYQTKLKTAVSRSTARREESFRLEEEERLRLLKLEEDNKILRAEKTKADAQRIALQAQADREAQTAKVEAERKAFQVEVEREALESKACAQRVAIEAKAYAEREVLEALLAKERQVAQEKQQEAERVIEAVRALRVKTEAEEKARVAKIEAETTKVAQLSDKETALRYLHGCQQDTFEEESEAHRITNEFICLVNSLVDSYIKKIEEL